ncbi:MFS transporter [Paraburkholderia rhizosphaerae]|uniref:Putative MFS family arabinose efflux permease n=1 Tax=Paraburkholderia rhizosphaerae TaxID=480658 RepID=A0A4R8LV11_9BURK|nr:MFS transporter [Paraburkholderia rhizosphaerae]TDY51640.1 putative MFS family arabinose efflux permease [Paraburkholderia rhizosphaerae]
MTKEPASSNTALWALAAAQLVAWGAIYYAFSLFVVPMESSMGWSRTATNAALSVGLLVSGLAAWPVGVWIDHGHGRQVMVCGSLLATAMLALWSQAHSLVTLFIVWIGLGIAMAATLYDPLFAIITRRFPDSFRKKITLITLAGGFASTVFIPLTQSLVHAFGWRDALLALAAINLVVCLPFNAFALGRDGPRTGHAGHPAANRRIHAAATQRALRTPTFWALAVCFTAYYSTFAALTFHLVPLMTERNVSTTVVVATMAVIGPAQVLARVLWFTIGRNVRPSTMGIVITTAFPASVVILMLAGQSSALLMLFATVYGGANGMMTILRGTIVQDVMWTEGYGAVSGLLSMPSNIAKGIAPISAAAIWSIGHNYVPVEWTVLLVSLVSAAAFVVAVRFTGGREHQSSEAVTTR